jgi:hypothetical protein
MPSVRLLEGVFEDVDSYALQDYEAVPIGTVDQTQLGLGVVVNGDASWGDTHLEDQ